MEFEKWEGLGNDFLVTEALGWIEGLSDAAVAALCDRRRGVGADGLLGVSMAPHRMLVRNADGSRPEMCGNGLRCVVGYLASRGAPSAGMQVSTDAGWYAIPGVTQGEHSTWSVAVAMGPAREVGAPVQVAGVGWGVPVDVGNPHFVFLDPPEDIERWGPPLEHHPAFPRRTNVEGVWALADGGYRVRVWERGCGFTEACGTGATAVAHVLCDRHPSLMGQALRLRLPGGELSLTLDARGHATMEGPARRVFRGVLD